jgi:hypothetical protein
MLWENMIGKEYNGSVVRTKCVPIDWYAAQRGTILALLWMDRAIANYQPITVKDSTYINTIKDLHAFIVLGQQYSTVSNDGRILQ